jgi:hypothetical protein
MIDQNAAPADTGPSIRAFAFPPGKDKVPDNDGFVVLEVIYFYPNS